MRASFVALLLGLHIHPLVVAFHVKCMVAPDSIYSFSTMKLCVTDGTFIVMSIIGKLHGIVFSKYCSSFSFAIPSFAFCHGMLEVTSLLCVVDALNRCLCKGIVWSLSCSVGRSTRHNLI